MPYIEKVRSLLNLLGISEGEASAIDSLNIAAQWALNDPGFTLGVYEPTALRPVLETIKNNPSNHYCFPEPLSLHLRMPQEEKPNVESHFDQLKQILNASSDDLLLANLEVMGAFLAVNDKYNDLSLFDFIKITVGIAECLERGNGKLRLIGGCVSGIQTYLYDIISKNAAKLLKGRSFYIQLLVDSLLDEFLNALELSPCHVIYSSGGGFYLMVADSDLIENQFKKLAHDLTEKVYEKHKTSLFVDVALTDSFTASKGINVIWDELFVKLNRTKNQRLSNNSMLLAEFLKPAEFGGTKTKDPITNDEIGDGDAVTTLLDNTIVLQSTKQQIELGKDLRKANYWIVSSNPVSELRRETIIDPFGKYHYLEEQLPNKKLASNSLFAINTVNAGTPFVLYGGNRFPVYSTTIKDGEGTVIHRSGDIIPFDELVENEDFKSLAILRMDVDGLGNIFSAEISCEKYLLNLVRYATVSHSLDYFFKGYINVIQQNVESKLKTQGSSVIIYSGGDDLFLVGKWDTILALGEEIHMTFDQWSCSNLTISGGMQMLPAKFPIMQGARMTEEVESKAKNHRTPGGQMKNTISIFEKPLNWITEFPIMKELQETIYHLISDEKMPHSFIGKVNIHASAQAVFLKATKEERAAKKEGKALPPNFKPPSYKWKWTMAYDISRFKENTKDAGAKSFIHKMATACFTNYYDNSSIDSCYSFLTLLQIACRWAEYRLRSERSMNSE